MGTVERGLLGFPQDPPNSFVPPDVGEAGTSSVHVTSPSLVVNVTCKPVFPSAELPPLIEVASYFAVPVARSTSAIYIEPAQSGP